jgi:tripartite-type tricarboxylate transporter receptor subunit TctC
MYVMHMARRLLSAALAVGVVAAPQVGSAQESYPSRPIRLIVPFGPGGSSDASARPIAEKLSQDLGQPVVVENRSGGQTVVGADIVAKSPPDGYTLFYMPGTHLLDRYLVASVPFDPVKDFTPISRLVSVPFVFVTSSKGPFSDFKGMLAYGEKRSGGVSIGNTDALGLLASEKLKEISKTNLVPINYRSAPAIVTDVLGGHLEAGMTTPPVVLGFTKDKHSGLIAMAVTSARRVPSLPNVPTVSEATGLPDYDIATWYGIAGPANLPPAVVARLEKSIAKVMADPALRERLISLGVDIVEDLSARAMAQTMKVDTENWSKLADRAGLKPQ